MIKTENLKSIKKINLAAIVIMAVVSFTSLLGLPLAGTTVLVGIVFFFIDKGKTPFVDSGLDIMGIGKTFSDKSIWLWVLSPLFMDILAIMLARLVIPAYIDHVLARTGTLVSFKNVAIMTGQFAIYGLGEEIAWRAFFQRHMQKAIPVVPAVLITSILFGIGHASSGDPLVVLYDIIFVIINSCLYGVVFYKTKNAWISTISHFASNMFCAFLFLI